MPKAVILASGGLDSLLVIKLMGETNIPFKVVHFDIGLTYDKPITAGQRISKYFGLEYLIKNSIEIDRFDVAQEFYTSIINSHNAPFQENICIQHKIFLLAKAHQYMIEEGAEFIVTGDIIDQRPLIQGKDALLLSDKKASVEGLVFRPLSAKNLPDPLCLLIFPQLKKIMYNLKGFSSERQQLAEQLHLIHYPKKQKNIDHYETDMGKKAFEIFEKYPSTNISHLYRVGIHFQLSDTIKLVIGRTPFESNYLKLFYNKITNRGSSLQVIKPRCLFGFLYGKNISYSHEQLALRIFSYYINSTLSSSIMIFDHEDLLLGEKVVTPLSLEEIQPLIIQVNDLFCPLRTLDNR